VSVVGLRLAVRALGWTDASLPKTHWSTTVPLPALPAILLTIWPPGTARAPTRQRQHRLQWNRLQQLSARRLQRQRWWRRRQDVIDLWGRLMGSNPHWNVRKFLLQLRNQQNSHLHYVYKRHKCCLGLECVFIEPKMRKNASAFR